MKDNHEPTMSEALTQLRDALLAPLVPLLERLNSWLERHPRFVRAVEVADFLPGWRWTFGLAFIGVPLAAALYVGLTRGF